ncbi:ATP-dependent RNA helicase HrpA [Thiomicrorhabdus sp.]|uniref:ATP-dependent RNA helicase HrpA n=1 Tax=Thiomicrorhabdus sp. TaxID=2039724 RepID=UPI0029C61409|nr:ATP-dependent RNA helicase HrpA [Thiomicrorhabdus sp.]
MSLKLPQKKLDSDLEMLQKCLIKDRHKLLSFHKRNKIQNLEGTDSKRKEWFARLEKSIEQADRRRASVPKTDYDEILPIAAKKTLLVELVRENQVVIIAGETGSGKTTQIPKICLDAGRGVFGKIGCTQPRRLAARSVAERLAEELHSRIGDKVGYQVRFMDQVAEQSLIKVMTDGILLAEVQNDRYLSQYDTIIIDEAHERSVNIDFLLGILKQLLPKRPDLKVIITSATIDTQRFADHFAVDGKRPPVVEVSGRTYPVEVRYRPLSSYEDDAGNLIEQDTVTAVVDAVDELGYADPFGDILVFQVGERDIKETAEALKKQNFKNTEIVPLYARLSLNEQQKVFQTSQKRRIILSTNVAETSLTVPGIKYVIDPGLVRISRYSVRSKVQRLPIEKISQASANQRKGRCGRVSEGICIRLYDEDDFNARPAFTDPEIHRTSLASIILSMTELSLGEVSRFPFLEAPTDKAINDGYRQLHELGALDENRRLTPEGKRLARLPIDPGIAKMVIEGEKNGVLAEVIIIAAVLSIQDPRDLNETNMQAARKVHKSFEDERSDFLFFLNLWRFYENQRRHLSQSKLRKLCKTNFLSYLRMKEWHELTVQLEQSLKRIGMKVGELHLYEEVKQGKQVLERLSDLHSIAVHRSLLAGLLGNISLRDEENAYQGARNTRLFIHPSSVLFKRKPKWMLSAELVETTKLYARNNAEIDVTWLESLAGHLIKKRYSDPHWQKRAGQVGAYESITLYGLPIVNRRPCNYGSIDPVESRKLFLRHALVQGEMDSKAAFLQHNRALAEEIRTLESKLRRPDFLVDDEVVFQFYDARIPQHIYSKPAFERWWKKVARQDSAELDKLYLQRDALLRQEVADDWLQNYPDQVELRNQLRLDVDYCFDPGKKRDGLIFHIPLVHLNLVNERDFEWLSPGLLKEKVAFFIKSLPKAFRKQFVPVPQYCDLVLSEMSQGKKTSSGQVMPFLHQLVWALNRRAGSKVAEQDFAGLVLPDHLLPSFVLEDDHGKQLAQSDDLAQLKRDYLHLIERKIQKHHVGKSQGEGVIEHWDFGDLQECKTLKERGTQMVVYPYLKYAGGFSLQMSGDLEQALEEHARAVLALIKQELHDKYQYLTKKLPMKRACLCYAPYGTCQDLTGQVIDRALHALVPKPEAIRRQAEFESVLEDVRLRWVDQAQQIAGQLDDILSRHQAIARRVKGKLNPRWLASIADIRLQLDTLIAADFVRDTPEKWFKQLPRYLQALEVRLEKIDLDPGKDQKSIRELQPLLECYKQRVADPISRQHPDFIELRWLLEELRISLFSQPMKTIQPVSIARLQKKLNEM